MTPFNDNNMLIVYIMFIWASSLGCLAYKCHRHKYPPPKPKTKLYYKKYNVYY